jgi:hypothetical protein
VPCSYPGIMGACAIASSRMMARLGLSGGSRKTLPPCAPHGTAARRRGRSGSRASVHRELCEPGRPRSQRHRPRAVRGFPTVAAGLFGMLHPKGGFYQGVSPSAATSSGAIPSSTRIEKSKTEPDRATQQKLVQKGVRYITGQMDNEPRPTMAKLFTNWWPALANVDAFSTYAGGNIWGRGAPQLVGGYVEGAVGPSPQARVQDSDQQTATFFNRVRRWRRSAVKNAATGYRLEGAAVLAIENGVIRSRLGESVGIARGTEVLAVAVKMRSSQPRASATRWNTGTSLQQSDHQSSEINST